MSFDEIQTMNDIQRLFILPKKSESHYLEYKKIIKGGIQVTTEVAAFANASGGLVVFGIDVDTKTKLPIRTNPLTIKDNETDLDNYIDAIQPRIFDYRIKVIPDTEDETLGVFFIEVKKGKLGPYMASDKRYYIRREKKSEPMNNQEVREAIFRSGLFDALILELKDNNQLIEDFLIKIHEIKDKYEEKAPINDRYKDIQAIIFPFKTEAWKAITYSGLLSVVQQNSTQLIELYQSIYQVNQIIEALKFGHRRIVTQQKKQSSYYILVVIESTIRQEIKGKIENILKSFTEREQKI